MYITSLEVFSLYCICKLDLRVSDGVCVYICMLCVYGVDIRHYTQTEGPSAQTGRAEHSVKKSCRLKPRMKAVLVRTPTYAAAAGEFGRGGP